MDLLWFPSSSALFPGAPGLPYLQISSFYKLCVFLNIIFLEKSTFLLFLSHLSHSFKIWKVSTMLVPWAPLALRSLLGLRLVLLRVCGLVGMWLRTAMEQP